MMRYVNNTAHLHYVYVKISAHHCRVGLLQCRNDFSNLSEAIVHAANVPLLVVSKLTVSEHALARNILANENILQTYSWV